MIKALLILYGALNLLGIGYMLELMIDGHEYCWFMRLYNDLHIKYNVVGALIPTIIAFIFFMPATIITYVPFAIACVLGGIIVYGEEIWSKLFKRKYKDEGPFNKTIEKKGL